MPAPSHIPLDSVSGCSGPISYCYLPPYYKKWNLGHVYLGPTYWHASRSTVKRSWRGPEEFRTTLEALQLFGDCVGEALLLFWAKLLLTRYTRSTPLLDASVWGPPGPLACKNKKNKQRGTLSNCRGTSLLSDDFPINNFKCLTSDPPRIAKKSLGQLDRAATNTAMAGGLGYIDRPVGTVTHVFMLMIVQYIYVRIMYLCMRICHEVQSLNHIIYSSCFGFSWEMYLKKIWHHLAS